MDMASVALTYSFQGESEGGSGSLLIFLDLSAVFYTTNHGVLLERLAKWGVLCFGGSTFI